VQILASREAMLKKLKELLAEQTELQKKNRLLEVWIIKHMRKVRFKQFSKFYVHLIQFLFCTTINCKFYFFIGLIDYD